MSSERRRFNRTLPPSVRLVFRLAVLDVAERGRGVVWRRGKLRMMEDASIAREDDDCEHR
jgi:hypothetical protein